MVFQFKIQIKGITKPPVWRKVSVPANFTFLKFHDVIQTVFGWGDYHLFEFKDKEWESNIRIAVPVKEVFLILTFLQIRRIHQKSNYPIFSQKSSENSSMFMILVIIGYTR